jgi:hypothetical protein
MGLLRFHRVALAVCLALAHQTDRVAARTCDVVADCGAPTDNATIATPHLLACFAKCGPYPEVVVPAGVALQVLPLNLTGLASNGRLVFGVGAALYATCDPTGWPLVPMLPLQVGVSDCVPGATVPLFHLRPPRDSLRLRSRHWEGER